MCETMVRFNSIVEPKYANTLLEDARDFLIDYIMEKTKPLILGIKRFRGATLFAITTRTGAFVPLHMTGIAYDTVENQWHMCRGAPAHNGELIYLRLTDMLPGVEQSMHQGVCGFVDKLRTNFDLIGYVLEVRCGENRGERYVKFNLMNK